MIGPNLTEALAVMHAVIPRMEPSDLKRLIDFMGVSEAVAADLHDIWMATPSHAPGQELTEEEWQFIESVFRLL